MRQMAGFSFYLKMQEIAALAASFYKNVLFDEEPLFVSDEATLFDVWSGDITEILDRCSQFYGVSVTMEDAQLPLWKFIPHLVKGR